MNTWIGRKGRRRKASGYSQRALRIKFPSGKGKGIEIVLIFIKRCLHIFNFYNSSKSINTYEIFRRKEVKDKKIPKYL